MFGGETGRLVAVLSGTRGSGGAIPAGSGLEWVGWRRPVEFTSTRGLVVLGSRSPAFDEFTEKCGVPLFPPAVAGVSLRRVVSPDLEEVTADVDVLVLWP